MHSVFSKLKRAPTTETFDSITTMSTASVSSNNSRPNSRDEDELRPEEDVTGFPSYFRSHTTSRRHPDAITTPGACITADDVDPNKALNRSKHSLLRKHKRTVSHGKIDPDSAQSQSTATITTAAAAPGSAEHAAAQESGDGIQDQGDIPVVDPEQHVEHAKSGRRLSNPFKRWRN